MFLEGRWLWRRYGCVKWYAGELLDAYAALTLALDLGYPASRVFHARGQVLAELGRYDDAIEELTEALRIPRSSLSAAPSTKSAGVRNGNVRRSCARPRRVPARQKSHPQQRMAALLARIVLPPAWPARGGI